jgi:hypothetical protein
MTSQELLAAAKDDSYLTFVHEDGTESECHTAAAATAVVAAVDCHCHCC